MKRILFALALFLSTPCFAQTLGSYVGTSTTYANTPLTNPAGAVVKANSAPVTIPNTTYVTYHQGSAPVTTTTYTTTYTGNLFGATGSLTVTADDFVAVSLNGILVGTTTAAQWNQIVTFAIPATAGVNGVNTLTFAVTNTAGNTGMAFTATITPRPQYQVTCTALNVPNPPPTTPVPGTCTFSPMVKQ